MIFGTTQFGNGKRWGRLEFDTGKVVILKPKELAEFEAKIAYYQATERIKERDKNGQCFTCGKPTTDKPCDHIHLNQTN